MTEAFKRLRMRHLRCFQAMARHGSVSAAAEQMHSSQPALSRALAELEALIGQPLFLRTGRGLSLTEAGESLRRHVDAALSQLEAGTRSAAGLSPVPVVSVGMLPNVARTLAVAAAGTFKAAAPQADLRLYWAGVPELVARLHRSEIDFLLGRLLALDYMPGVRFEHLYFEPLVFVVARDHPFAGEPDAVTLDQVRGELVVVPMPDTIIRRELDKFTTARGHGAFPNKIETVSFEFTRSFIAGNRAVACVPLGAVRQEIADGLLVRLGLTGEELMGSVGITHASDRKLSAEAQLLVGHVRDAAKVYA
ncbi:LysR substrate-binding domain-containing protein [Aquibium sp. ELW1220]|jgi:LysR family pca operon transcriptional activator|uniref:LysR substrate-binding domain-containing protein n=1 Tax=Aquibium sp. ELW1220 TaxID=2976766 RepID=UPI0025B0B3BE|nr:LysR substrate-binding domain-containing protein [Aquibium sp. ELW1220]MDN2579253.1 LysR substrate-binding domain-containing protein [Aquibium sp. ELW1220]